MTAAAGVVTLENMPVTRDIEVVYAFTAVVNTPFQRVMQRLGMERIGEFDHPALPAGDWLQRHVLYRIALRKN